ncbi:MAG TPA: DNA mismatch repair protein MutS [Chloroflexia bacterium]|nr:DNA mismatch repair protein MutS [Chloroflexia bacterium]
MAETEMNRQYKQIKEQYPDAILFFRLGDFYETFNEDAHIVHRELGLTLTHRAMGKDKVNDMPMAGLPYHSIDRHLPKLIERGYKVAICEQMTKPGAKLVKREVIRVVTPGTVFEDEMLVAKRNNFLAALILEERAAGLAYADISTGEFLCTQINESSAEEVRNAVKTELARIMPSEILAPRPKERRHARPESLFAAEEDFLAPYKALATGNGQDEGRSLTPFDGYNWQLDEAARTLKDHFEVGTLESFGCAALPLATRAAGALVSYLRETQKATLSKLNPLVTFSTQKYMALDLQTRRNLELSENRRSGSRKMSLFGVLDQTQTSMGGRMLHRWLNQPLLDLNRILARQEAVAAFYENTRLRESTRALLKEVDDIERFGSRAASQVASPREMLGLLQTLELIPAFQALFNEAEPEVQKIFKPLLSRLHSCEDLVGMLQKSIPDDPPGKKWTKGAIRDGYSAELDRLRQISNHGESWIEDFKKREVERTGISSLKVSFNQVFGYYIEVTTSNLPKIPADYIRKQTIANGERFITPELKDMESQILNAQERIEELEADLFKQVLANVSKAMPQLVEVASALSHLDVFAALAEVAITNNYCRPVLNESKVINIKGGRHPVVEQSSSEMIFVPNDACLNSEQEQILLITGPNMAGKSVYLRQVAVIVLMAQIGAFVPAESATIGLVDRIFTRVGAQDDIATGQSTFMVEMVETSYILSHATPRSLVILDEVGRGTSTYDGLAIAQAVVEYIHNNPRCGAKTLFATHYHELIELAQVLPRVRNYNMAVREDGGKVIFMRKVLPGGADRSYGIHVAQLAGLPRTVIRRAEELLQILESQKDEMEARSAGTAPFRSSRNGNHKAAHADEQMSLFAPVATVEALTLVENPVVEELRALNVMELSPLEAINKLYELQQKARQNEL